VNGVEQTSGWLHLGGGVIAFHDGSRTSGAVLTAGLNSMCRCASPRTALEVNRATFAAGEMPSVPLVEIRE
jgi:hypothetical protein